jgi:predicted Zn-dependent protease
VLPETLQATAAGQTFVIPLHELQLELGGASHKMVFCRPRDKSLTFFCEDANLLTELHAAGVDVQALRQSLRRKRQLNIAAWALMMLTLLAIGMGLTSLFRHGVNAGSHFIPTRVDQKIGDAAFKSMDLGGKKLNNVLINGALKTISQRLTAVVPKTYDFRIQVVRSNVVNAFALPGGQLVVYTGLLKQATSPEQVAAVLAHEMAHVIQRHGVQRILQSVGMVALAQVLLGDVVGIMAAGKEVLTLAAMNSYSREQELQADAAAIKILNDAHLTPIALKEFFGIMQKQLGKSRVPAWFSTHPEFNQRLHAVQKEIAVYPKGAYQKLPIDWSRMQKELGDL